MIAPELGWLYLCKELKTLCNLEPRTSEIQIVKTPSRVSTATARQSLPLPVESAWLSIPAQRQDSNRFGMWAFTVVCKVQSKQADWRVIRNRIAVIMDKDLELIPFDSNLSIIKTKSYEEQEKLCGSFLDEGDAFSFSPWSPGVNNIEHRESSIGGWIGLVGLPFHLWNREMFADIGTLFGALESIDDSDLAMAKLKVGGDLSWIPSRINIEEGDEIFQIEVRLLQNPIKLPPAPVFPATALEKKTDEGLVASAEFSRGAYALSKVGHVDSRVENRRVGLPTDPCNLALITGFVNVLEEVATDACTSVALPNSLAFNMNGRDKMSTKSIDDNNIALWMEGKLESQKRNPRFSSLNSAQSNGVVPLMETFDDSLTSSSQTVSNGVKGLEEKIKGDSYKDALLSGSPKTMDVLDSSKEKRDTSRRPFKVVSGRKDSFSSKRNFIRDEGAGNLIGMINDSESNTEEAAFRGMELNPKIPAFMLEIREAAAAKNLEIVSPKSKGVTHHSEKFVESFRRRRGFVPPRSPSIST